MFKERFTQGLFAVAFKDTRGAACFLAATRPEFLSRDEAPLKVVAELSCLVYQLTKIPFIEVQDNQEGRENLRELIRKTTLCCQPEEIEKIVELRGALFEEAQASREVRVGKAHASQSVGWVWEKVRGEEIKELEEEAKNCQSDLGFGLQERIENLKDMMNKEDPSLEELIKGIFDLAILLGVKNELNLFHFMTEKQRRRIALGRKEMTAAEKEREWKELLPLARQCFR